MENIRIWCKNTGEYYQVEPGTDLATVMQMAGCDALAAYVDNQLKELGYPLYMAHSVEFLDYSHPDGRRCYKRSIYFVLQKAIEEQNFEQAAVLRDCLTGDMERLWMPLQPIIPMICGR